VLGAVHLSFPLSLPKRMSWDLKASTVRATTRAMTARYPMINAYVDYCQHPY
jgi:hypothetical protein